MKVFVLGQRRPLTGRDVGRAHPYPYQSEQIGSIGRVRSHNAPQYQRHCTRHKCSCRDQMQKAQSHVATFSLFSEARQLKQWISSHLGGVILCNKLMYNKQTS